VKRFTETEKWRDSWFRRLEPDAKLAFLYMLDNCDAAGVWDPDFELANFQIGRVVNWEMVKNSLSDRLEILPSSKWHLCKFVGFQYGQLSEECKPHLNVLRLIEIHGIQRVSKGYPKGLGKGKGKGKGTRQGTEPPFETAFACFWSHYPRREAKGAALKAFEKLDGATQQRAITAAQNYALATSQWPDVDRPFIPHPATWLNSGRFDDDPKTWIRKPLNGEQEDGWDRHIARSKELEAERRKKEREANEQKLAEVFADQLKGFDGSKISA
jgi:hypothetical protein